MNWSEEKIDEAFKDFQPKYAKRGENLTRKDAIQILDELYALADILIDSYEYMKSDISCEI